MVNKAFCCSRTWCTEEEKLPSQRSFPRTWCTEKEKFPSQRCKMCVNVNWQLRIMRKCFSWVDFPNPCSTCFPRFSECSAWIPRSNWAEGDAPNEEGKEGEETGIPDWVIWVSERPHMGPRPIRRLVVGDTEAPEEISCGHQRKREGKRQISKKEGWRLVGAGWWWLSFVESLFSSQRLRPSSSWQRGSQSRKFFPDQFFTILKVKYESQSYLV